MNQSCSSCKPAPSLCPVNCCLVCCNNPPIPEPLIPAVSNARTSNIRKPNPKCTSNNTKRFNNAQQSRKDYCPKPSDLCSKVPKCPPDCPPTKTRDRSKGRHPLDCACITCEKKARAADSDDREDNIAFCESFKMNKSQSERSVKNYMFDNPELTESKAKKKSTSIDITECIGSDNEVWILQCPKGFDPKKLAKKDPKDTELKAKCFKDKVSLACLTPEKAAEYSAICDGVKMIYPVGKITVTAQVLEPEDSCSESDDGEENTSQSFCDENTSTSKKVKKKINDQKFTIETTVTVESCGDNKKKSSKMKRSNKDECIPISPAAPIVAKKSKRNSCEEDLSWMDC